jgi:hypothetical protein
MDNDARTDVEFLSLFCVPAALASALGVSRTEAAAWIQANAPGAVCADGAVYTRRMAPALGVAFQTLSWDYARAQKGSRSYRSQSSTGYPTVAQWLQENPGREAILTAGFANGHAMHVRNGQIVEDNGRPARRARVVGFIPLD